MEPLRPGDPQELGSYRLLGRLGAGGMGVVFLGQTERGAPVAVKVIRDTSVDSSFRARFRHEVEAALRVSSPYTARVLDADVEADTPFLVTEFVAGETLRDHVARLGPLDAGLLVATAAGLAAGLAAIHAAGVAHRDLSPGNVMLTAEGPRIIDLGVAHVEGATQLTATGTALGTPGFMSPEHARGGAVGAPADIFAWGSLVAFAATGRPAFGSGRAEQVLYRIAHEAPDLAGVPDRLAGLVAEALDKEPAVRPPAARIAATLAGVPSGQSVDDATRAVSTVVAETWGLAAGPDGTRQIAPGTVPIGAAATTPLSAGSPPADAASTVHVPADAQSRESRSRLPLALVAVATVGAVAVSIGMMGREPAGVDIASADTSPAPSPLTDDSLSPTTSPSPSPTPTATDLPEETVTAPDPEPELADAPGRPGPPEAPWATAPVAPTGHLVDVATSWYGDSSDIDICTLYAPTEIESGMGAVPATFSPAYTRLPSFEFGWEDPGNGNTIVYVTIWDADSSNVVRFFDEDPEGTTFADGSVMRGTGFEKLLAVPGEDCFYEFAPASMVALDWTFASIRPIAHP